MLNRVAVAALAASFVLPPAAQAAPACVLTPVATLVLRDTYGFLTVPAALGDHTVSMLLDTGSDAGLLAPEIASRADARIGTRRVTVHGASADTSLPVGTVPTLGLGALLLTDVSFPIHALPASPRIDPPIAGLLGGDVLSHFELDLDLPHGTVRLYAADRLTAACAGLPPWHGPFRTLVARRAGNRLFVPATLDDHPTEALLDTGARSRIVSTDLAAALGVSGLTLGSEPGGYERGIAAPEATYHWHRFATLEIANETARRPVLTVAPLAGDEPMLLGTDWFASHRVWLSYATGRVFVAPATGTVR